MSTPAEIAAAVESSPGAMLLLLGSKIVTPPPSAGFRIHSSILLGLYGLMVLTFALGSYLRFRGGSWWLFSKDSRGYRKINIFLVFQLVLSIYSGLWMTVIALSINPILRPTITLVFQLTVFLPLAFSGFGEIFALVSALPTTRAIVSLHGSRTHLTRLQRLLESRTLLRIVIIGCPIGMLGMVIPLSVLAGMSQHDLQAQWSVVAAALAVAAETGWTTDALEGTLGRLQTLSDETSPFVWIRWTAAAYVLWTTVHQILYLPATYAVYTLLTEQRALLLKSIFNASALYTLNVADVELDLPPSTFTDFAERTTTRPSIRSDETKCSGRPLSAKRPTSSRSSNSADIGVQHDDVTEKLKTVVVNRKLVILQAVVTESMALGLLGFSIFNACNGMQHVSLAQGRIIYILVPTYSFLAPTLVASIVFGHLSRRPAANVRAPSPVSLPSSEWVPYPNPPPGHARNDTGTTMVITMPESEGKSDDSSWSASSGADVESLRPNAPPPPASNGGSRVLGCQAVA